MRVYPQSLTVYFEASDYKSITTQKMTREEYDSLAEARKGQSPTIGRVYVNNPAFKFFMDNPVSDVFPVVQVPTNNSIAEWDVLGDPVPYAPMTMYWNNSSTEVLTLIKSMVYQEFEYEGQVLVSKLNSQPTILESYEDIDRWLEPLEDAVKANKESK